MMVEGVSIDDRTPLGTMERVYSDQEMKAKSTSLSFEQGTVPDEEQGGAEEILEGLVRGSRKGMNLLPILSLSVPYSLQLTEIERWLVLNCIASYDIEKEGEVVAVFTLVKTAYRLGETVAGMVHFNDGDTGRRVLKVGRVPLVSIDHLVD